MSEAERWVEIETKVAFQDEAIRKLQESVIAQQREIDRLKALVEHLRSRLTAGPEDDLSDEPPPPHYRGGAAGRNA